MIEWKTVEVPFSKTSIRIMLSQLCAVLNYAVEKGVIEKNPALKHAKLYKGVKNAREKIEPLSAEEVEAFLAAVLDRSCEYYRGVWICRML